MQHCLLRKASIKSGAPKRKQAAATSAMRASKRGQSHCTVLVHHCSWPGPAKPAPRRAAHRSKVWGGHDDRRRSSGEDRQAPLAYGDWPIADRKAPSCEKGRAGENHNNAKVCQ